MEKLKEGYTAINPDVQIEIQQSDSTTGMESALNGTYDIGMASRELKDSETEGGLTGMQIALDGIAVIVKMKIQCLTLLLTRLKKFIPAK